MKKNNIAKRVVILLVILMLHHFTQASLNSFDQGIPIKHKQYRIASPPPIVFSKYPPRPHPRFSSHPPPSLSRSSLLP
nr:hypothetical protein [Tanacetum cinerariifolium]